MLKFVTHHCFWTPPSNCYCSGWSALVTKTVFFSNPVSAAFSPTKPNSITQSKNKETQNSISAHVPFCDVRATGLHGVTLPHRHLAPTSQPDSMVDSYTFQMLVFLPSHPVSQRTGTTLWLVHFKYCSPSYTYSHDRAPSELLSTRVSWPSLQGVSTLMALHCRRTGFWC